MNKIFDTKLGLLLCGVLLGLIAIVLAVTGNPQNMAFCIACFIRDMAGATKFHQAAVVQYFRPEIVGIVVGAFFVSVCSKEFKVTSGSSPLTRFLLGICIMILALVFLGCPLRMVIRMSAGDLNAYVGLAGFVVGNLCGGAFLKSNYLLTEEKKEVSNISGYIFPVALIALFIISITTTLFASSESGPGSMHAPVILSIVVGLIFGGISQKARTCFGGSIRNIFFAKDISMFATIFGIFITLLIYNIAVGKFNPTFEGQPIAHNEHLYNFLSMLGVGIAVSLAGGCPLRQLVLAGQGGIDNVFTVLGMFFGAAIAHNFSLASSANGTTPGGRVATYVCICIVLILGMTNIKKAK